MVVNSTKSYLTENPISKSVILDFTVKGMKAVGSQSMVLSQGESETYSIAIVSLIDSDSTTSRVSTEISGEVDWWVEFDGTEEFEGEETLIVPVGQPEIFTFTVIVPDWADSGNYEFNLKVTDYNDPSHVSTLTYNLYVRQVYDIEVDTKLEPFSVDAGSDASWNFRITNNGNGGDRVDFELIGLPVSYTHLTLPTIYTV